MKITFRIDETELYDYVKIFQTNDGEEESLNPLITIDTEEAGGPEEAVALANHLVNFMLQALRWI